MDAVLSPGIASAADVRPRATGPLLSLGGKRFTLKGVTYGTFRSGTGGDLFPDPERVNSDFGRMAENGLNSVRTYTVPPRWLLDLAAEHGLGLLVGLPWQQHVTFLDSRRTRQEIVKSVRAGVRLCREHPNVFAFAIGNEIPAGIVRWHGRKRVEDFLKTLYETAKAEDPGALATYSNYPTTEYLHLPYLDFCAFNVFLEQPAALQSYVSRLHNIAGNCPLVITEMGLDSRCHGEAGQAASLTWQLAAFLGSGCAGTYVFSWTDEWWRGGSAVTEWAFGLTDESRRPRAALAAVRRAYSLPVPRTPAESPPISVVVCAHNAGSTLRRCIESCLELEYPNYEVIVVDDGSTDDTVAIAESLPVRLSRLRKAGLSAARNKGLQEARGEIVAYIDADAWPDRRWLAHLADSFHRSRHAGIGGPNVVPPEAGLVEECVANSPGGPIHVLLTDELAEHIPGCNMAFRKDALHSVGGFDTQFTIAGDDVDICWLLQQKGNTLGFNPAAIVWHRRRKTVRAYWKQQVNYGRAEAMLEHKWPDKYSLFGHPRWAGRLYGPTGAQPSRGRWRVYHGVWGGAPFQHLYVPEMTGLSSLGRIPEWYLVIAALVGLGALGLLWWPMLGAWPLAALAIGISATDAAGGASQSRFTTFRGPGIARSTRWLLTWWLHLLQPAARLAGRLSYDLTPWRARGLGWSVPFRRKFAYWAENRAEPHDWLTRIERSLCRHRTVSCNGGEYDRWDIQTMCGIFGGARLRAAVEDHEDGRQMLRVCAWPWLASRLYLLVMIGLGGLAVAAALDGAWIVSGLLAVVTAGFLGRAVWECGTAIDTVRHAIEQGLEEEVGERIPSQLEHFPEVWDPPPVWAVPLAMRPPTSPSLQPGNEETRRTET